MELMDLNGSAVADPNAFAFVGEQPDQADRLGGPGQTYLQDAMRRFRENKAAVAGVIILCFFVVMSFLGPVLSGYQYNTSNLLAANQGVSAQHWFGTDDLGRDIWARVWKGGQMSILIGVVAALLQGVIGVLIGSIAGFVGGRVDNIIMRIVEFLMAFPYLVWVMLLMMVTGSGVFPMILALTLTGWLSMARLVRGQILSLKHEDYVVAASSMGGGSRRIILKHMIPNMMGIIIVNMTFAIPGAIFSEAFLSFIGIGISSPQTSWGLLVNMGMKQIYAYPTRLLIPCVCISLTMLSLQLIGDGLRDALDPKLRR
ncbi:MAG: ABC transporter permease [Oscillibacter sp.]|jgi:oligopeptide transport system permease protein|nr:ABC transporter permease [Oscillibacter sp.]